MKFVAVVLAVTLLAVIIYNAVPQNQVNRQSSNNGSESSATQSAAYWWSMIRTLATSSNARVQSFTPTKSSTSPTVPLTNQTAWVFDTGTSVNVMQSPSLAAGSGEVFVIPWQPPYVNSGVTPIYALNASTGAILWSNAGDAETTYKGIPAFAEGIVYADAYNPQVNEPPGNIYAFNATTGAVLWNYTMSDGIASNPSVTDGSVYVWSGQGNIHAFNAMTGAQEWNYTINSGIYQSPTVADGVVFASTSSNATVYALNASTGAILWTSQVDGSVQQSSPAVAGGFVYVDSADNHVYALNESSGTSVWNYTYTDGVLMSSPVVSDGVVYVGGAALCALNASTGGLLWNYTFDNVQPNEGITTNAIVVDGVVYFGSAYRDAYDHDVYALNATSGSLIWSYITGLANGSHQYTGGTIWFSPAVDNDMVFVGSGEYVYAFGQPSARALSVAISPSYVEMDVSESQVFTSNVTGGNSPYTFQWYLNGTPILGTTNSSWTFLPISSGSYSVSLEVIDSLGTFVTSTSARVTVTGAVPPVFSVLNPGPESCPADWNASSTIRYLGTSDFVFYSNETSLGSTFVVNITVTNVTDLYAWGIGLVYDNTTLEFVNASLPTDNIFSGATASGGTLIQPPVVLGTVPYNEENGGLPIIEWGATFIQGSQNWCFNGTGTVAQLEFRIIKAPNSTTPQITSPFTLDPDWTTTIYWPTLDYWPEPSLGTASFAYIS
jgi:outer membrane protein assembly factor BamB